MGFRNSGGGLKGHTKPQTLIILGLGSVGGAGETTLTGDAQSLNLQTQALNPNPFRVSGLRFRPPCFLGPTCGPLIRFLGLCKKFHKDPRIKDPYQGPIVRTFPARLHSKVHRTL